MSKTINTTTRILNDLGDSFPIGVVDYHEGKKILKKSFELRDLPTENEKALGRFRKQNERSKVLEMLTVTKLMSLMFSDIAGEKVDFSNLGSNVITPEAVGLFKVNNLYVADVFYAYCRARINEMGDESPFPLTCPSCGHTEVIQLDLTTMDVLCVDDPEDLDIEVELYHGFDSPNGGKIKKVYVTPQRWGDLCSDEFGECGDDEILMKLYFIEKSTKYKFKKDGKELESPLGPNDMKQLKKVDREKIATVISTLNVGPSFTIDGKCPNPNCNLEFPVSIDWRYADFFSISSQ